MDKGLVIGSGVLLALAILFTVLILALPPGDVVLNIGFGNTPWLAVGVLAVIGAIMLYFGLRGPAEE